MAEYIEGPNKTVYPVWRLSKQGLCKHPSVPSKLDRRDQAIDSVL